MLNHLHCMLRGDWNLVFGMILLFVGVPWRQAVALTGCWLDLWDHPEHGTCKVLKGVKEFGDGKQQQQQQPESGPPETQASTSAAEEAKPPGVLQGLNPAKVIGWYTCVAWFDPAGAFLEAHLGDLSPYVWYLVERFVRDDSSS